MGVPFGSRKNIGPYHKEHYRLSRNWVAFLVSSPFISLIIFSHLSLAIDSPPEMIYASVLLTTHLKISVKHGWAVALYLWNQSPVFSTGMASQDSLYSSQSHLYPVDSTARTAETANLL